MNAQSVGNNYAMICDHISSNVPMRLAMLRAVMNQRTALYWQPVRRTVIGTSRKHVHELSRQCRPCKPTMVASFCSTSQRSVRAKYRFRCLSAESRFFLSTCTRPDTPCSSSLSTVLALKKWVMSFLTISMRSSSAQRHLDGGSQSSCGRCDGPEHNQVQLSLGKSRSNPAHRITQRLSYTGCVYNASGLPGSHRWCCSINLIGSLAHQGDRRSSVSTRSSRERWK